jgi:acylphosphatase
VSRETRHVLVEGRVQGVGYRAFARRTALGHGVTGWARNLDDGRVELRLSGSTEAIDAVIEALKRGPQWSRVRKVTQTPGAVEDFDDFTTG